MNSILIFQFVKYIDAVVFYPYSIHPRFLQLTFLSGAELYVNFTGYLYPGNLTLVSRFPFQLYFCEWIVLLLMWIFVVLDRLVSPLTSLVKQILKRIEELWHNCDIRGKFQRSWVNILRLCLCLIFEYLLLECFPRVKMLSGAW